jgi:hypothetical protein
MTKEQKKRADELQKEIQVVRDNLDKLEYIERMDGAYLASSYGGGRVGLVPDISLTMICVVRGFEESRLKKLEAEFAAL